MSLNNHDLDSYFNRDLNFYFTKSELNRIPEKEKTLLRLGEYNIDNTPIRGYERSDTKTDDCYFDINSTPPVYNYKTSFKQKRFYNMRHDINDLSMWYFSNKAKGYFADPRAARGYLIELKNSNPKHYSELVKEYYDFTNYKLNF